MRVNAKKLVVFQMLVLGILIVSQHYVLATGKPDTPAKPQPKLTIQTLGSPKKPAPVPFNCPDGDPTHESSLSLRLFREVGGREVEFSVRGSLLNTGAITEAPSYAGYYPTGSLSDLPFSNFVSGFVSGSSSERLLSHFMVPWADVNVNDINSVKRLQLEWGYRTGSTDNTSCPNALLKIRPIQQDITDVHTINWLPAFSRVLSPRSTVGGECSYETDVTDADMDSIYSGSSYAGDKRVMAVEVCQSSDGHHVRKGRAVLTINPHDGEKFQILKKPWRKDTFSVPDGVDYN